MSVYDAIVVGGGHNGLTAAAYLARAGRRVLVLESREILGGYCTTEENVPEAPGFRLNPCALDCLMTSIPRSIIDDLSLSAYGLRLVDPEPWGSYLGPDGESIGLWRDRARTVREIRRLSPGDAERFEHFCAVMRDFWWAAAPYLQDHPTRPRARTLAEVVWRVARGRRSIRPMARMLLSSPEQILEEWFDRDEVKAFLANLAIVSYLPLQEPGSGAVLGATSLYIEWGARRPVGGSGAFTGAIAACARRHGASMRCGAPVDSILVDGDGHARGVRLVSGEEVLARQVVGAVDPSRLVGELVPSEFVPAAVQRELRGLGVLRWNISTFKSDVALSARSALACGRQELWNGFLLLGPTLDYIRRAQLACVSGAIPDEPWRAGCPQRWWPMPSRRSAGPMARHATWRTRGGMPGRCGGWRGGGLAGGGSSSRPPVHGARLEGDGPHNVPRAAKRRPFFHVMGVMGPTTCHVRPSEGRFFTLWGWRRVEPGAGTNAVAGGRRHAPGGGAPG